MNRTPYLVKFFHSGAEKVITSAEKDTKRCLWSRGPEHSRKFVVSQGKYVEDIKTPPINSTIGYWCEWEAESFITENVLALNDTSSNNKPPRYIHTPILPLRNRYFNTDPCVIGGTFIYSNCKQNTRKGGETHMQKLCVGDIVVFGSAFKQGKTKAFACDTVFVVSKKIKFNVTNMKTTISNLVPKWYYNLTLNSLSKNINYTLYIGATHDNPVDGMFSFTPCVNSLTTPGGFKRPFILQSLNNGQTQGSAKITTNSAKKYWNQIVNDILDSGLYLGVEMHLENYKLKKPSPSFKISIHEK